MARRRTPSEPPVILVPASQLNRPRRGLSRENSAFYIDVSPSKFDQMVADGRMPKPIKIDSRRIWDMRALDRAFDALAAANDDVETNSWNDVV